MAKPTMIKNVVANSKVGNYYGAEFLSKFYNLTFILLIMDLYLDNSTIGKGVFANKNFKKGDKILRFKDKLMKRKEIPDLNNPEDDRYVQIEKNKYLGPSNDFDDFVNFVNHSCNPNSGLKIKNKDVILIAIKNIKKGEEIT